MELTINKNHVLLKNVFSKYLSTKLLTYRNTIDENRCNKTVFEKRYFQKLEKHKEINLNKAKKQN